MDTQPTIDVVILTVLLEEYQAVHQRLDHCSGLPAQAPDLYAWELGHIPSSAYGSAYSVALGMIGRPGNVASALATSDAITKWKPNYVFFVGIAGGLAEVGKGDVVIADMIYGYEYGKLAEEFMPRRNQTFRSDIGVINLARKLSDTDLTWATTISVDIPAKPMPKALVGDIASGEKVVDDATNEFFSCVVREWPKLTAIEMEAVGSAAAIEHAEVQGQFVRFAMFRGISDLPRIDQQRKIVGTFERDLWKRYAAHAAASFATALIASGLPLPPQALISAPTVTPVSKRLSTLGLGEPSDQHFGKSAYSSQLGFTASSIQPLQTADRFVILAALPVEPLSVDSTHVLESARTMLEPQKWYNGNGDAPKYWPPKIFNVPTRRRSAAEALIWEDRNHNQGQDYSLENLAITGLADVCFTSALRSVSIANNGVYVFSIGQILADFWRLSGLVAQLYKAIDYSGSTSLCIGMIQTMGSHLGGFSDRWNEPDNHNDLSYWRDLRLSQSDWSCHSPHLRFQKTVNLLNLKPKQQPDFIQDFAEAISLAYNHDLPRCFEAKTGKLPERYFHSDWL